MKDILFFAVLWGILCLISCNTPKNKSANLNDKRKLEIIDTVYSLRDSSIIKVETFDFDTIKSLNIELEINWNSQNNLSYYFKELRIVLDGLNTQNQIHRLRSLKIWLNNVISLELSEELNSFPIIHEILDKENKLGRKWLDPNKINLYLNDLSPLQNFDSVLQNYQLKIEETSVEKCFLSSDLNIYCDLMAIIIKHT